MYKRSVVMTFVAMALLAGLPARVLTGAEATRTKRLDLSYITADFYAAAVVYPQRIARSPAWAPLLKDKDIAAGLKELAFDPLKIEQALMLFPVPAKEMSPRDSDAPSFVLRLSPQVDLDEIARQLLPEERGFVDSEGKMQPLSKIVATTVAGKNCYKLEAIPEESRKAEETPKTEKTTRPPRWVSPAMTCVADERTVLMCLRGEADLKKMLSAREVKSPLVERLRRADLDQDAVAVFALEPVREMFREGWERDKKKAPPPVVVFLEILPLLESATITLSLTDDTPGRIVLQAANAESAAKVEEQAKSFPQKAKDQLAEERKMLADRPEYMRASAERTMSQTEKFVNGMAVTRADAEVVISVKNAREYMQEGFKSFFEHSGPQERTEPLKGKSKARINGDKE